MDNKTTEKLELNKILSAVAEYAVLEDAKRQIEATQPQSQLSSVRRMLQMTEEASRLLFRYGIGRIEYFPPFQDELERAAKGAALSCGELLACANLLRSARVCVHSISSVADEEIVLIRELTANLYFDERLEGDIFTKIIGEDEVSDYASEKLYILRSEIRSLNERIRSKLQEYLSGEDAKYLQDGIITMRNDRYVLPVKAEYKRSVKGFVHDKSQSGNTVFIEPEYILEMNNELKSLEIDEREEVERILSELSRRVGAISKEMRADIALLTETDALYAKAEYAYKRKCVKPLVNAEGRMKIIKGRHPLIPAETVVPVSLELGGETAFLLLSGPNTGGKTVTLKMTGLFSLMVSCGLFVPAAEGSEIAVFEKVFCDIGDAQSIEDNLSTFSSHVSNLVKIVDAADSKSLVLIDELGGGTDPEEGQALARAVTEYLLKSGCKGIITTHFTSLKEYAYSVDGIENASMEFDAETLQPLYRISLGLPGSSNALSISKRLGLKEEILSRALSFMNEGAKSFENIVRSAEEIRLRAQREYEESHRIRAEWQEKMEQLDAERDKLEKEKENLSVRAKIESRRIINEKTAEAEELLKEIEGIFAKEELTQNDLIRARTLKNRLADKAFADEREGYVKPQYAPMEGMPKAGEQVFVPSFGSEGTVLSVDEKKKQAQVQCGGLKLSSPVSSLMRVVGASAPPNKKKTAKGTGEKKVNVVRNLNRDRVPSAEINLIGLTVQEALTELEAFMDNAVLANFEEVKIVHGFGTGKLKAAVQEYLRKNRRVAEFRSGQYGEGEGGVTIAKLK